MAGVRILDVRDADGFARLPPCADPGFDHRSCDYWEDAEWGSKAARLSWWDPTAAPTPAPKPAAANPFAPASGGPAFNPFAPAAAARGGARPPPPPPPPPTPPARRGRHARPPTTRGPRGVGGPAPPP